MDLDVSSKDFAAVSPTNSSASGKSFLSSDNKKEQQPSTKCAELDFELERKIFRRRKSLSMVLTDCQYELIKSKKDNEVYKAEQNQETKREEESESGTSDKDHLPLYFKSATENYPSNFKSFFPFCQEKKECVKNIPGRFTNSFILERQEKNNIIKQTDTKPLPAINIDASFRDSKTAHHQSAELFEHCSPVQVERRLWKPSLPDLLVGKNLMLEEVETPGGVQQAQCGSEEKEVTAFFPFISREKYCEVKPNFEKGKERNCDNSILNVGIVLSGGPAPGGHNVISGIYDYIKSRNSNSQLYGFLGGLDGLILKKYKIVTDEMMDLFRNQGGFDMLWSGRGKLNKVKDLELAKEVCDSLRLDGLIVVGGDGSNSNAALLSEWFACPSKSSTIMKLLQNDDSKGAEEDCAPPPPPGKEPANTAAERVCSIVGVPKTIDGDLKNKVIETSFGFDTATKIYSELIGNLCIDVNSSKATYHFVRVMGRSASHLVLECAFQTRPNMTLIGEEVEAKNIALKTIVNNIADMIMKRLELGKKYGIILVPEGLIEFIPELKLLIENINKIIYLNNGLFDVNLLEAGVREVWEFLPEVIREQLLMNRENTGYVQVAKIATEKLFILLVESELANRGLDDDQLVLMSHYFGYEGRCALPSNFDANYCYSLGYISGVLIENKKNGYMAVVRNLDEHQSLWTPAAIPFTDMMCIKEDEAKNLRFPAITRSLIDLQGPLFKVFCEVRDVWLYEDLYRNPGPIQFRGPVSNICTYTIKIPKKEDLLCGFDQSQTPLPMSSFLKLNKTANMKTNVGRSQTDKHIGCLSPLQLDRLHYRPPLPPLCADLKAGAKCAKQHLLNDPYTQRQILLHFPYMANQNKFYVQEVVHDKYTPPIDPGIRVGVVFISQQSPGVSNILWGLVNRLDLIAGCCFAFYGLNGLIKGNYLDVSKADLELFFNQGGIEIVGRSTINSLLSIEQREAAKNTCEKLLLDGLIITGSAFAMTETAMLAEYFLSKKCRTSVIGVPATSSNNLVNDLIETAVGFDSSTKVYASLIGNVLTDAASMPKYWHFIRLMGRQPSHEVLECALQTHPNFVIISEEYGAQDKTLFDVVKDIADVVCRRAEIGKHFGTVLIPDALLLHLPNMKSLLVEIVQVVKESCNANQYKLAQHELINLEENEQSKWVMKMSPWSLALFKSLPKFIRKEILKIDMGEMRFEALETEELLAQMVTKELARRKKNGIYSGNFSAVTHFFGYQGRSSMPSQFDANLAFAYGHLACILVESGLTGYCCSIRGLCANDVSEWKLYGIPFISLMKLVPGIQSNHFGCTASPSSEIPVIPSAEVNIQGKAFRLMKTALESWAMQDRFCNPGPIQYHGFASTFTSRMLFEDQAEYYDMIKRVECYLDILKDTCKFGVSNDFLKYSFVSLSGLLYLAYYPDYLIKTLGSLTDIKQYEAWARKRGDRRNILVDAKNLFSNNRNKSASSVDVFQDKTENTTYEENEKQM